MFLVVSVRFRVLKQSCLAVSSGPEDPEGFRELREAGRKHLHLSWHLSDSVAPSYGEKLWVDFYPVYGSDHLW